MIRFVPNEVQTLWLDEVCPRWRDGDVAIQGLREEILKARQFGFSTLILALIFLSTVNNEQIFSVVIAHDARATEILFKTVRCFHDHLPERKKRRTSLENSNEISYPDLGSLITVFTAGTKTIGRSTTIHNLHCSEVAFWKNQTPSGLYDAVTAWGNVFKESTANGEGNAHHLNYKAARGLTEFPSGYTARFYAWWQHSEYQCDIPNGFKQTDDKSPKNWLQRYGNETDLQKAYGLTLRQLAWRRRTIDDPNKGGTFRQEYPANWEEAFTVSGSKFFPEWDPQRHVLQVGFDIPSHWDWIGGLDWGFDPGWFAFELAAISDTGDVHFVAELYAQKKDDDFYADLIVKLLLKRGLDKRKVRIYADPSMWNQGQAGGRIRGYANIHAFLQANLWCIPADNDQKSGNANFRSYLVEEGAFNIHPGCCPMLEAQIPAQKHAKSIAGDIGKQEGRDRTIEDHAFDAAFYLLHSRIRAARKLPPPPPTVHDEHIRHLIPTEAQIKAYEKSRRERGKIGQEYARR